METSYQVYMDLLLGSFVISFNTVRLRNFAYHFDVVIEKLQFLFLVSFCDGDQERNHSNQRFIPLEINNG